MEGKSSPSSAAPETRRAFIKKSAKLAALAGTAHWLKTPIYGQEQAPSANVLGANNRINVAYIGVGAQGMAHVKIQKEHAPENNIAQVAVCDVFQKRLDEAQKFLSLKTTDAVRDHRQILDRKDVDAVVVSTIDTWHAEISKDALQSGKHVFCEKPMSRYLADAFDVYDAVKKSGKTYVIGSQGCMDPKWHKAAEWIKAGRIGPLVWGQASYCRNHPKNSEWTHPIDADANETSLDWNRWLGRAPKIPFNPEHYFSWHKFYAYNSGIIGNLLPHRFQPLMLATGNPEFPRRVACTGTRKVSLDREITDTTHLLAEFPGGLTLVILGSTVNEVGLPEVLRGHQATLHFSTSQNTVELTPERQFTDDLDAEQFSAPESTERIYALEKNFFDCIRSGKEPVANVDLAIRAHTVLCLAEMSERLGLTLYFDAAKRQIKTSDGRVISPITYDTVIPDLREI